LDRGPEQPLVSEILARTSVFAALSWQQCAKAARHALEHLHAKGDVVFNEDCSAEGLYLLARGSLRLTCTSALGGSLILREQAAPAAIVSLGLLDGGPNCATATASSDSTTYVLLRDPFLRLCHDNPDVTIRLLAEIAGHLRRTSAFIDLVTATGTCQRIARALLELMEEAGSPSFELPCTHADLACRLGTVRELIYRNLKALEARGVLHFSGTHIEVHDAAALSSAAAYSTGAAHIFEAHAGPPIPACFVLEWASSTQGDPSCRPLC
jgi:CRP/FNR family transcriptional regulator